MNSMGFRARWKSWMEGIFFKSSLTILVNGSATEEFEVRKGLRQGDPMSSFLFVLDMEGLLVIMRKAWEVGSLEGFKVNETSPFDLVQFADNTLIFGRSSWWMVFCRHHQLFWHARWTLLLSNFWECTLSYPKIFPTRFPYFICIL